MNLEDQLGLYRCFVYIKKSTLSANISVILGIEGFFFFQMIAASQICLTTDLVLGSRQNLSEASQSVGDHIVEHLSKIYGFI